jgi:DNA-binding transcriptional regulator YiaG
MNISPISKAIQALGLQPLAKLCGVTYQAVRKWEAAGRLPRTEWTGETDYASKISAACADKGVDVSVESLKTIRSRFEQKAA